MKVNNGIIQQYRENIDNKVIQAEGEIYWETKLIIKCFSSNEQSSGLGGMILVMLNQQLIFNKNLYKNLEKIYILQESWLFNQ